MAICATCGTTLIFGGVKDGKKRYCNQKCYEADEFNRFADKIPDEIVEQVTKKIHDSHCPKCEGSGPVDIHHSYSIYSVIVFTSWKTNENLVCKKCASKQQTVDLIGSLFLGWWGFPLGLIMTPIQLVRNIISLGKNPGAQGPSGNLRQHARLMIAANQMEE